MATLLPTRPVPPPDAPPDMPSSESTAIDAQFMRKMGVETSHLYWQGRIHDLDKAFSMAYEAYQSSLSNRGLSVIPRDQARQAFDEGHFFHAGYMASSRKVRIEWLFQAKFNIYSGVRGAAAINKELALSAFGAGYMIAQYFQGEN